MTVYLILMLVFQVNSPDAIAKQTKVKKRNVKYARGGLSKVRIPLDFFFRQTSMSSHIGEVERIVHGSQEMFSNENLKHFS